MRFISGVALLLFALSLVSGNVLGDIPQNLKVIITKNIKFEDAGYSLQVQGWVFFGAPPKFTVKIVGFPGTVPDGMLLSVQLRYDSDWPEERTIIPIPKRNVSNVVVPFRMDTSVPEAIRAVVYFKEFPDYGLEGIWEIGRESNVVSLTKVSERSLFPPFIDLKKNNAQLSDTIKDLNKRIADLEEEVKQCNTIIESLKQKGGYFWLIVFAAAAVGVFIGFVVGFLVTRSIFVGHELKLKVDHNAQKT